MTVDFISCLIQVEGPVRLILCYTTPDIHYRDRRHERDGGIKYIRAPIAPAAQHLTFLRIIEPCVNSGSVKLQEQQRVRSLLGGRPLASRERLGSATFVCRRRHRSIMTPAMSKNDRLIATASHGPLARLTLPRWFLSRPATAASPGLAAASTKTAATCGKHENLSILSLFE